MSWIEDLLSQYARQAQGGGTTRLGFGGNTTLNTDRNSPLADPPGPGENAPQRPGPAANVDPQSGEQAFRQLLGQGATRRPGPTGAPVDATFKRYAVKRGNRLMEAHDYGGGDVKLFARKNPALLEAAIGLAQDPGSDMAGYRASAQRVQGMSPEDQERIRYLLGR